MKQFLLYYQKRLNSLMLLAIVAGVLVGYYAPQLASSGALIGELFIRLLTMLIVPVIVVSMMGGILNLESSSSLGRLGLKAFVFYTFTTALAVIVGLSMVNIIQPGKELRASEQSLSISAESATPKSKQASAPLADVLRNIIPKNIIKAATDGNVLGLIFFSIFISVALLQIGGEGTDSIRKIVSALFDSIIWMVDKTMLVAPLGVYALVAAKVAEFVSDDKFAAIGTSLFWYAVTVIAGLLAHAVITLPILLIIFRIHPWRFFLSVSPAITTAFSTASSAATLPVTIDSLEKRAGIPNRIASFVAPLGATVNMDGTAIYEAVAAIFIANVYGIQLGPSEQLIVFLTATISAVGAAGIPGAGLIMLTLVLGSVGIPAEGIALIIGIDRFLDMIRTGVNVWGDCIGAAVVHATEDNAIREKS